MKALEVIIVILVAWLCFNMVDWKHNPHHTLKRAVHLTWNGYGGK